MFNQEYLEKLIQNKVEENLNLEYKSAPALNKNDQKKINEISKDVSAFANANGGILIYGILEKNHLPTTIDPIKRTDVQKEWLEQKIQDCIRPKINGIIIHPITIDNDSDKVIYLLEIPQSSTAHQAQDKKYFRRHNFNVLSMYDHEIRDILNRIKHPKINLRFCITHTYYKKRNMSNPLNPQEEQVDIYELQVFAKNLGVVYANFINCTIIIPKVIFDKNDEFDYFSDSIEFNITNKVRDVLDSEIQYQSIKEKLGPASFEPILPKCEIKLQGDFSSLKNDYRYYQDILIKWTVFADNAEPQEGSVYLNEIEVIHKCLD
jgi:hypothetical protein